MGDDEVERVNINKLKEYHSKIVVVNVIVANAYVERYPNRYHQNKSLITKPTNSFRLVPKPKKIHGQIPYIKSYMMSIFG
jgi:hypothetical protein